MLTIVHSGYCDFVETEVPTTRGDVGSSYYGWGTFTQAYNALDMNESGTPCGMMFSADDWAINYYEPIEGIGAIVNASFSWDTSSYEGAITEWAFMFNGTSPHNVLDTVSVDVFTGAVPGATALFVFGLCGLRSRRRQN